MIYYNSFYYPSHFLENKEEIDIDEDWEDLTLPTIRLTGVQREALQFPPEFPEPLKKVAFGIEPEKTSVGLLLF